MKTIVVLGVSVAFLTACGLLYFATDTIPPDAMTRTRMTITERRIRAYAEEHGRLPQNLSDLPKSKRNQDDSVLDGWGKELMYVPRTNGSVTLASHGKLGESGNTITMTFRLALSGVKPRK